MQEGRGQDFSGSCNLIGIVFFLFFFCGATEGVSVSGRSVISTMTLLVPLVVSGTQATDWSEEWMPRGPQQAGNNDQLSSYQCANGTVPYGGTDRNRALFWCSTLGVKVA